MSEYSAMPLRPEERLIYHITDIENLPGIMAEGGLLSDAVMSDRDQATYWADDRHQKQAEFLVADFFPWSGFHEIGCHNPETKEEVTALIAQQNHRPKVSVKRDWYY
jgi:ssDNA thymidine ADP-ribosyltransferase DarT-like protein